MSYSILIVDDSMPMRSVIKKTFKAAGYKNSQFHEAEDGEKALLLMKNSWIDLVVTDYNMPVMNGLEFVRALKQDILFKDIPVIAISTEGNESKIKEFTDCGVAGYITKPFTPEIVRDLLINILGEESYDGDFEQSGEGFDF